MKHTVAIFDKANKAIFGKSFKTAQEAYDDYQHRIAIAENILASGEVWKVVRFNDGKMMAMHECIGK